jgi:hypothetical protein
LTALEPFVGLWSIEPLMPEGEAPPALRRSVTFEWLPEGGFLIERWEVPTTDAPNGLAVIGPAPEEGRFLQYQFDSREEARIYAMELSGETWRLWRSEPDLSPLDFHQRFAGTFGPDRRTITGHWQSSDDGVRWREDFGLLYRRAAESGTAG